MAHLLQFLQAEDGNEEIVKRASKRPDLKAISKASGSVPLSLSFFKICIHTSVLTFLQFLYNFCLIAFKFFVFSVLLANKTKHTNLI